MACFAECYDHDEEDSSTDDSTEESSTSDSGADSDGQFRRRGILDLSWGEYSVWPDDVVESGGCGCGDVASGSLTDGAAARFSPAIARAPPLLELRLDHNEIKRVSPRLGLLKHLVSLDVSDNRLTALPDVIVELKRLRKLVVKNNNINDQGIPKDLGTMQSLRLVNMAGNELESLPPQLCELRGLKSLFVGGNRIRLLPFNVADMEALETLYLGGNRLEHVPATLGKLPRLRVLSLCNNRLVSVPSTLVNLRRLKSLSLHGNRLTTLPQEIVNLDLRELSLRDNPLVNKFVGELTFQAPSLRELSARVVTINRISYDESSVPRNLVTYLNSAKHCVNPRCAGVYFDARVEIVNFVDFCGKFRLPLLQYLCSPGCSDPNSPAVVDQHKIAKVLLG